ncbi:MAG: hypothetical protein PHS34_09410 [Candidatus Omnitrophica bacterium]|nr:hypothetical protein [Candidatus Omnitrophota bacterium]
MALNYTYYLNDIDITKYVKTDFLEFTEERKLTGADTLVISEYQLNLLGNWSIFEKKSPFYNIGDNLKRNIIKSYWNNGLRFEGYINNMTQKEDKILMINVVPKITKFMENTIALYVDDNKTPAATLRDLLEWLGLQDFIDYPSFNGADNIQDYFGLYCTLTIEEEDTITLQDICNQIADISCADIYLNSLGKICFLQFTEGRFIVPGNQVYNKHTIGYELTKVFDIFNKYTFSSPDGSYTSDNSFAQSSIDIHGEKKKDLNFDTSQAVRPTTLSGMQWGAKNWVFRNETTKWQLTIDCMGLDFYPSLLTSFKTELFPDLGFEIISVKENTQTGKKQLIGVSV